MHMMHLPMQGHSSKLRMTTSQSMESLDYSAVHFTMVSSLVDAAPDVQAVRLCGARRA